ncbi:MAG: hypothetical protein ACI85K_003169 [Hyphomicrobiaceae bacterium]|jgi:hypothetical protein
MRCKRMLGDRLHARDEDAQVADARLACIILNRMTEPGMPVSCAVRMGTRALLATALPILDSCTSAASWDVAICSRCRSQPTCRRRRAGYPALPDIGTQMEITNKTRRPIKIPLPDGKKLFLGPGKSAQVNPKAAKHPPVMELVAAGDLELDDAGGKKGSAAGDGSSSSSGSQNSGPTGNIRRTGDR